ncbi:MAG: hypothetical protein QGF46_04465 [Planctomycetota bacterium]|nr:hypothetical protein [Planctomycetota bacterium]
MFSVKFNSTRNLIFVGAVCLHSSCSSSYIAQPDVNSENDEPIIFNEDPFADEHVEIVAKKNVSEISAEDLTASAAESKLVELDPSVSEELEYDYEEVSSELRLAALQAKILTDELSKLSIISVNGGIHTMGDVLRVNLSTQNPFGDIIELKPPSTGLVFEFNWTIERWGAMTERDKVQRHRVFYYPDWFVLEPGEEFREFTDLPLEVDGERGAAWIVDIDARIRCESIYQGSKNLPVHQIDYQSVRFLVLPPGWQQFVDEPLANLEQAIGLSSAQADLHVLVCVALLPKNQRHQAVELLISELRKMTDPHRALSITQALAWLTGQNLGSLPHVWLEWAEQYNL